MNMIQRLLLIGCLLMALVVGVEAQTQRQVDSLLNICRPLAQTDIKTAEAKLLAFKQQYFGFPAELYIAQLYDAADRKGTEYRAEVAHAYDQMSMSLMSRGDMELYILSLFYSGRNDACVAKAREALTYYPQSLPLNRFFFRSLVSQGRYRESLTAYENLTHAQPAVLEHSDSVHYSVALTGWVRYLYQQGKFEEAAQWMEPFAQQRRQHGQMTDDVTMQLANIYIEWAKKLEGAEKEQMLLKADAILAQRIPETTMNDDLFAYMRVQMVQFQLDPEASKGTALPAILQMEEVFKKKADLDERHKERLVTGYRYLMSYYFIEKEDYALAAQYADKILLYEPNNDGALQVRDLYRKVKNKG